MFSFEVKGSSPEEFTQKLQRILKRIGVSRLISIERNGSSFVVTVAKGGTSVFHFNVIRLGKGFTARLRDKKVSFIHLPFAREIEQRVRTMLEKMGGKPID
jgi:hypothetical protein